MSAHSHYGLPPTWNIYILSPARYRRDHQVSHSDGRVVSFLSEHAGHIATSITRFTRPRWPNQPGQELHASIDNLRKVTPETKRYSCAKGRATRTICAAYHPYRVPLTTAFA
jgi:hypothetical protein